MVIILANIIIVTLWYIYGHCLLTDLEHYIYPPENNTDESDERKNLSFITIMIETYFPYVDKKVIYCILSIFPALTTLVCLVKLYIHYPRTSIVKITGARK